MAHLIHLWHERNGWSHRVLPLLSEVLDLGKVHNSQISNLRNGKLSSPGPEVFLALAQVNTILDQGIEKIRDRFESDYPELWKSLEESALPEHFINSGLVLVNYKTAKAKTPLKNGDNIQIWMPPPEPLIYLKPEKMDLNILFEDEHIIVINKQSGLIVHPAPGHKSGTLVNGLLFHCKDLPGINGKLRPGIVHRLDKDTSGCMVVAKSQEALVNLQKQIKEKIASREYIAVIHGAPNSEEGQIVGHIGRDKLNRLKYKVVEETSGRYACTYWKLEERFGNYS